MSKQTKLIMNKLKIVGFSLYFIILFGERIAAAIYSANIGDEYALKSGNVFNYIAYGITIVSLVAGVILFVKPLVEMVKALMSNEEYPFEEKNGRLITAVAALLYGGMMHTGLTIPGLQFTAYGFLIAAMIIRCIEACLSGSSKFVSIVSVIYLTLFSMTIPVCYISFMEMPRRTVFYIFEFAAAIVLVTVFGRLLYNYMQKGSANFDIFYPGIMLLLSGATVYLKWNEEINWFVLIFVVLTIVFYLVFGLTADFKKSKIAESKK
ncbi:MAG: hypothetical protein K5669_12570 [Lachnospiraceae bacterium]|nr:hypothetical protein [Lachnospiraceae bacterium]